VTIIDAIASNLNQEQHDRLLDLATVAPHGWPDWCLDRVATSAIDDLCQCGVVHRVGHEYRLTPRGMLVVDRIGH